jgi:uncharacterized membrane protein YvlD (DUF360 family)
MERAFEVLLVTVVAFFVVALLIVIIGAAIKSVRKPQGLLALDALTVVTFGGKEFVLTEVSFNMSGEMVTADAHFNEKEHYEKAMRTNQ